MTIQDALSEKQDKLRRRLFDLNILRAGREYDAVRITSEEFDMYGNPMLEIPEIQSRITVIINYPDQIPLERIRVNSGGSSEARLANDGTSSFFFDVLPIEIYSKFTNLIEKEDYIIHRLEDENGNSIPVILKITDSLGTFGRSLTWRKLLAAPYTDIIPESLSDIIEDGDCI